MPKDYTQNFLEIAGKDVDGQCSWFLHQFVLDLIGNTEEILEIGEAFKKVMKDPASEGQVDEWIMHQFLENRNETLTVKELRDSLKQVKLANHHPVALIEYLLWRYKKTAEEGFEPPKGASPELLAELDRAIEEFKAALAVRQAREERMSQLEATAQLGGVKGMKAKHELEGMKSEDEMAQRKREITSEARKRRVQKLVENDNSYAERLAREKAEKLKEETARMEAEKARQAEEERQRKEASRQKLAARAAMFNQ